MFSQSSVNIPAALILILLAVLQAKVDRETVGQKVVKLTCSPPCWPSGNCYYDWNRNGQYVGCFYSASLWLDSTRPSDHDSYTCEVKNSLPQQNCELPNQHWGVTYTSERVCALKGSSVDLSCTYKHPEGLTVNRSFWFIESLRQPGVEPEDVKESDQYKGRVQYSRTLNSCRMTITDLRESDAHTYSFRFYTDDPGGRYSGRGAVTLSVTDLKVTVSDTDGGVKKLTCSSTCTLPNNPTYIWYRNGQPVSECESASCHVAVVSEVVNYSCAVKGSDLHSPPVYNRTSVYAASGGAVVLLLIFTAVFLWMRRRAAVTSSKTEKNSGEAPRTGDDTYSALNPNTMSSDYDTLTHFRDSPSGTYSALNPNTMSSDYETLTVGRPHPAMRRAPENEN
ncbi:uncharacterized protein LOC119263556 [Pygocentrus nattereri]|uniref:uncharacterized protein LOC119263556 n=1 Tax=Pygocentrus nattereri TaxID=42514 RepID=UPI001890D163|nr:uncharacterized protein LOC119263556 [Pygocentrus nattereri]